MAEKTGNEIWDDMKNAQEALVDENLKKYKAEKDNLAAQADANAAAESAGGSADYQNYATPSGGGIQADAVSRLGLNKGKLSETNLAGGYNAYQSRLAAAARQAQNAKDRLELGYNMYGAQSQAEKSNAQANYNAMKNSEYWKKANWDYQLAADKKAEEEAKRVQYYKINYETPMDPGYAGGGFGGGGGGGSWGDDENSTAGVPLEQRGNFMVEYRLIKNEVKKATKYGTEKASEEDRDRILNSAYATGWFKESDLYDLEKELGWG